MFPFSPHMCVELNYIDENKVKIQTWFIYYFCSDLDSRIISKNVCYTRNTAMSRAGFERTISLFERTVISPLR
jgi:hypothetical protein